MSGSNLRVRLKPLYTPSDTVETRICGKLAVITEPVSLLGDVKAEEGLIKGVRVSGRVVIMPYGVGSTVGSYLIYALKKYGKGPKAIIVTKADSVTAVGAVISDIPLYQVVSSDYEKLLELLKKFNEKVACISGDGGELIIMGDRL